MKYVKMLGLAAVAAAALMAFVGASSASATVLCTTVPTEGVSGTKTKGTTCPEGWALGVNAPIHAVNVGAVKLDTTFKTIECSGSTVQGENENEGSATETVKGKAGGTLTFTGCNCPTVEVKNAGTLEIHWIADTFNGTVTSSGSKTTTICNTIFGAVHCTYVTNNTDVGTLTGGEPAKLTATAHIPVLESESDGLCPEESTWTATYEVTNHKRLYVAAHT